MFYLERREIFDLRDEGTNSWIDVLTERLELLPVLRLRLLLQLSDLAVLLLNGLFQHSDLLILLGLVHLHLGLKPADLDSSLKDLLAVLTLSDNLLLEVTDLLQLILRGDGWRNEPPRHPKL